MPPMLEPQAPALSKLSTTAATDEDPSARGVQQAARTPKCLIDARADDDSDVCKSQGIQGMPTGEIVDADDEDQRDAIISILEDWAAWERNLEESADVGETKKANEAAIVTGLSGISAASLVDTHNDAKTSRVSKPNDHPASAEYSATGPSSKRGLRARFSAGDPNQLLYASRRERRRAERHDPIARARRQALKVWTADQTRRRSSAEESTISERLKQQGRGSFSDERATVSAISSRRSSAEATVDHNRKGGGSVPKSEWFRRRKPPYRAFAPREISAQRHVRTVAEIPLGPQRSTPTAPASRLPLQEAGRKSSLRYPWRANMKEPEKRDRRSAFDVLREGDVSTAPSTPRVQTAVVSSPSSSSLVVAGRGSAWARSPSRETAGGILVKHCFFYGSSDKATPRRAAAEAATASTSFESQWMRQFREEVQRNPNWWLGSDRFVHGRACASPAAGNVPGGTKGGSGRSARPLFPTALTRRGDGGMASRTTDLWNEVRLLLAAGRQSGDRHPGGKKRGHGDDHEEGDTKASRLGILSFGDRLRYTPLSQGAWLVGEGATATTPAVTASETASAENSVKNAMLSEEVHVDVATRDVVEVAAAGKAVEERGDSKARRPDALSRDTNQPAADESVCLTGNVRGEAGHHDRSRAVSRKNGCHDLQSIHAATLDKLRGEIDPFTREELVLRAAEEARGALARDRARNTSPRRASAGVFRPSSKARKRDSTPDAIDYDTVEATLSLIELATRAAGPDAGKQMLQALEDLDKIHQRVSDENNPAENERRIFDGKGDGEKLLGTESGLDGKVGDAEGPDATTPRAPGDSTAENEGVSVGGDSSRTTKESGDLSVGEQGTDAGGAVRAETEVSALNSNDHNSGENFDAGDVHSNSEGDPLPGGKKEGETMVASSPELGRKFSLAVSSSSEESAGSQASSVGVMQSIGNWLWSNTPALPSRQNSKFFDAEDADGDDAKGQEDGRAEFPSSFEGSKAGASELLEKSPDEKVDSSDEHDEGTSSEPLARGSSASVRHSGDTTVSVRVPEPAIELSGGSVSRRDSREPPPELSVGVVNDKQGDETETSNGVQDGAEEKTDVEGSGLDEREAQDRTPQTPARGRARRSSEADKPTGLPHLSAEIARVEESVSARVYDGDPASSVSQVSPEPISNREFKAGTTLHKAAALDEEITGGASDGAVGEGRPGERPGSEGEKACGSSPPAHVAPPKTLTSSQTVPQTAPAEDPCRDEPQTTEPRAEGSGSKDLLLQPRDSVTVGGSAPVEAGGARGEAPGARGNSPSSVLMHRDSWVSVGTSPRRGNNNATPEQPPPCVEGRTDPPPSTKVSTGRIGVATQAVTKEVGAGSDAIANKKGKNSGRRMAPKVSVEFVWPRPGSVCAPKRLRPPGESKDGTAPTPFRRAPGIVRRSPLIDALHPEVARQREFRGKRRQARQRDAAAPASETIVHPADVEPRTTASAIAAAGPRASTTDAEKRATGARASPIGASNAAACAATGNAKSTKKRRDTTAAVVANDSTDTAGASQSRRRRPRSRWAETAQVPAAPLPVASFRTPPSPAGETSWPTLVPAAFGAGFSEGASIPRSVDSATDDASQAGRLTAKQSERVEEWLARAERSLGPKVWTCLASSSAFRRTCGRLIRSIIVRGGGTGHTDDRPGRTENRERPPGGSVKPAPRVPGRSRRTAREGRKEAPHKLARKGGAVDREKENNDGRQGGGARVDGRGWYEYLSERTALVTDAMIWTIATERERKTTCAAIAEARNDNENGNDARGRWNEEANGTDRRPTAWGKGGGSPGRQTIDNVHDSSAATSAATTELRISLSTARRFVKRSRLTDGVHVVDADVDLAFKRWEEVERLAGPDQQCSSTAAAACGEEDTAGRVVSHEVGSGLAGAVAVPIPQKVCEAVGCSDPARYGDIGPTAKARLCRKHRYNGMVDVGSRRCERPDCGRLAVGAHAKSSSKATSLCTLHAREGRVDVEGMSFVLLVLSKARHTRRSRGKETKTASAAIGGGNQASSVRDGELAAAQNASAVRNVLLALTEQPLVPCSPTEDRDPLPADVRQGSEAFSPGNNTGGPNTADAPLSRSVATPTETVTSPRSASVASALDTRRGSQRQRHGSGGAISNSFVDSGERVVCEPVQTPDGSRETVPKARRRPSATAAAEAAAAAAAAAATASASRPSIAALSSSEGPGEQREEKDVVGPASRGRKQSHAPRGEESTGGGGDPQKRSWEEPRLSGHHATGASDEVAAGDGHQDEAKRSPRCRAARHPDLGSDGFPYGSGIDHRGGGEDQNRVEGAQQCRGSGSRGAMSGELAQTLDVPVGFGGRGGGGRRSGVDEVLEKNAPSLHAMFSKFSRQSTGCERGTVTMMTLCDVIRFCDSFELRPGLVSTREILDAYKTIAFPGVLGLSDEDVGYSNTGGVSNASDTKKLRKGGKDRRLTASCRASVSPEESTRQRKPSSESTLGHTDQAGIPASGDSKGAPERLAAEDTATLDATLQSESAPTEEGKLRALTLQDLASARPDATSREEEHVAARRGGDKAANGAQEGRGYRSAGSRRSTIYGERSNRGAGSRRGTTQQDDDECSLYFRSDSGAEGFRMPSPSRRTSTSSSSGGGGGSGGRGKRTVYLGRTQAFPLRRVESNLAVDARGFGLSGVCPDRAIAGDGSRQQASAQKPPTNSLLDKFTERTSDVKEVGGGISGAAGGAGGEPSATEASGLTEAQFFQWIKFVAVECKALTTQKAFGNSLIRPRSKSGRGTCGGKAQSKDAMTAHEKENGSRRQGVASAVVMLQWMEVSRGMRAGKGERIPPFQLSSCLANTMPLTPGE